MSDNKKIHRVNFSIERGNREPLDISSVINKENLNSELENNKNIYSGLYTAIVNDESTTPAFIVNDNESYVAKKIIIEDDLNGINNDITHLKNLEQEINNTHGTFLAREDYKNNPYYTNADNIWVTTITNAHRLNDIIKTLYTEIGLPIGQDAENTDIYNYDKSSDFKPIKEKIENIEQTTAQAVNNLGDLIEQVEQTTAQAVNNLGDSIEQIQNNYLKPKLSNKTININGNIISLKYNDNDEIELNIETSENS